VHGEPRLQKCDIGIGTAAFQSSFLDDFHFLCQAQALGRHTPVGTDQPTRTQFDPAEPADDQYGHTVALLSFYRLKDGTPGSSAGFSVVVEAVFLPDSVGPAVVGGIRHMVF